MMPAFLTATLADNEVIMTASLVVTFARTEDLDAATRAAIIQGSACQCLHLFCGQ